MQIEQLFSFNNLLFQCNYEKTEPDGRIGRAGAPRSECHGFNFCLDPILIDSEIYLGYLSEYS